MNVSLTPELEQIITFKVQSGLYNSASEVVREGIRLLQQRDEIHQIKIDALRHHIEEGIKASEEGRVRDGREVMTDIKKRLLQRQET